MIKYLGSKRKLVPVLGDIAAGVGARTAVDLFTGTTRVAQELKKRGCEVTATDVATYSQVLSDCYIATDARDVDAGASRTRHRPELGWARPSRHRIVVVLPDPFGPRKPNTPPAGTDRSRPSTARTRPPRRRR